MTNKHEMKNKQTKILKTIALGIILLSLSVVYACRSSAPPTASNSGVTPPPPNTTPVDSPFNIKESKLISENSPFNHNRPEHQTKTKDCGYCHERSRDVGTRPGFPGHRACDVCHDKDFFNLKDTSRPMCAACHKVPFDATSSRIEFPVKMTEFGLKGFSHKDHTDPAKMKDQGVEVSCATCHQFSDGVRASFPTHQQCYSCHAHQANQQQSGQQQSSQQQSSQQQAGAKNLSDCGACHSDVKTALKFTKGSLPALSLYNFKHSSHTKAASCDRCHKSIDVPDGQVRSDIMEISTARGQRHTSACWSCHNQKREFSCTKCHRGSIPYSF